MKKILSLVTLLLFAFVLVGCGETTTEAVTTAAPTTAAPTQEAATFELALVTDIGTIDDGSFNQGAWEGMQSYAVENGISYKYYQPATATTDDRVATIELAIQNGASTVVCPGYLFENVIWIVQQDHPDVNFIFLDGSPSNVVTFDDASTTDVDETVLLEGSTEADFTIGDNTLPIFYQEEQSGFLAGYAAVMDGYTELGFVGGIAVPAVQRFGYGFIQGAAYAAEELALSTPVNLNYWYSGVFWEDGNVLAKASGWYLTGTEVIFAAAGGAGLSVMSAAVQEGGWVIGVDVDQSSASATVITSAKKELANSVYLALESIYDETFVGGAALILGAEEDGVGLPQDFSRFDSFDQTAYDAIFAKLVDGTVTVSADLTVTPESFNNTYITVDFDN